ncbi:digestive cysteine proteinase 1 [Bacillus rossius redtenbacheri]|uniref:digestive cysteine proteinase 1 n=1 Tax=Bacillus rossius redtenbacheri TaxID=93214 RepID=UPI002FDEBE8C
MHSLRKQTMIFIPSILFIVVGLVAGGDVPKFSDAYTVKGTLFIPYAEIREPFFAYYDLDRGASRIDYYGDMVQTYQLAKEGEYGSSIKVVPLTTEKEANVRTCLQINGTVNNTVDMQSILPNISSFERVGREDVNGLDCEKWRLVDTKGEKVNKYTLWLRYKRSMKDPFVEEPIPVRYEMQGYNTLLGSHYDHYYLEYEWFTPGKPDPEVFSIEANLTCTDYPGPGDQHVYTFNPMREFVHGYDAHVDAAFDDFTAAHGKDYADAKEHGSRKEIFRQNVRFIHSTNRAGLPYQLSVNHLADRSELELKALRGKQYSPRVLYNGGQPFPYNSSEVGGLPESVDWRLVGAVTPVKDQSVCGSCWSFGTTGAVEGAYFLKHGRLVRLSQQALIDCSWGYGNNGCDGGEDYRSYHWIQKHGGLPLEDEYGGYLGQDGYCHVNQVNKTAPITGFVNVTSGDANALKIAVSKHGPISISIDAFHKTFSFYSNGIYYEKKCGNKVEELDHSVLLVGYGSLGGEPYWLVKNSWSNYWGNDGYVLMSPWDNNCGVATAPTYVTM